MLYYGLCMIDAEPAFPRCQEQGSDKSPISLPVVGASIKMDTTRGDGTPQTVAAGELCLIDWLNLLYLSSVILSSSPSPYITVQAQLRFSSRKFPFSQNKKISPLAEFPFLLNLPTCRISLPAKFPFLLNLLSC